MRVSVPALLGPWEHGFDPMMPTSSMTGAEVISPLFAPPVAFARPAPPSDLDIRFCEEDSEDSSIKFGIGKLALELAFGCCWSHRGCLLSCGLQDGDHCPSGKYKFADDFLLKIPVNLLALAKRPLLSACAVFHTMDSFFDFISLPFDNERLEAPSYGWFDEPPTDASDIPVDAERASSSTSYSYCVIS